MPRSPPAVPASAAVVSVAHMPDTAYGNVLNAASAPASHPHLGRRLRRPCRHAGRLQLAWRERLTSSRQICTLGGKLIPLLAVRRGGEARFVQLAFTTLVYPALILGYMGQAAYLSQHHALDSTYQIGYYISVQAINDLLDPTGQNLRVREDAQLLMVSMDDGDDSPYQVTTKKKHHYVGHENAIKIVYEYIRDDHRVIETYMEKFSNGKGP
uniref:Uncharacterized protein n=1 Tax=Oryza brachyantha TaxID=4533 RepID=J3MRB4_ORYBR